MGSCLIYNFTCSYGLFKSSSKGTNLVSKILISNNATKVNNEINWINNLLLGLFNIFKSDNKPITKMVEINNNKLTLKGAIQYKIPEQNISIGLNVDYSQATDNLSKTQVDPVFKAKIALKYGF